MAKVFVSYSRKQGEWDWDRLVPCLKAGGAVVLIDRERFEDGRVCREEVGESGSGYRGRGAVAAGGGAVAGNRRNGRGTGERNGAGDRLSQRCANVAAEAYGL